MRIRQHAPATLVFLLVQKADPLTPAPGDAPAVLLSRNGAAFTPAANVADAIGDGWYRLALTPEETAVVGPLIVRAGRQDTLEWRDIIEIAAPLEVDDLAIVDQVLARLRTQSWQIALPLMLGDEGGE